MEAGDRGRLTIFLGAAAGVGKTYTMLSEGRQQLRAGVDVKIGYIEPHERQDTTDMIGDIPVIPRKTVEYRGVQIEEMDLDAVIGARPELALVDELAHTNPPGSKHRKRFEDIEEILQHGIDVWTTVNIQHMESLNVVVYELTGVKVRETFPDRILEEADEIRLIDISPEALIERLKAGKVYPGRKIDDALANFFKKSNLTALRELSLREVADEVEEVEAGAEQQAPVIRDKVLLGVGPGSNMQRLVRRSWRFAKRLSADLIVVYMKSAEDGWMNRKLEDPVEEEERIKGLQSLCDVLGAELVVVGGSERDEAAAIVNLANERRVSQIIMGRPHRARFGRFAREPLLLRILEKTATVDVHIVSDEEGKAIQETEE